MERNSTRGNAPPRQSSPRRRRLKKRSLLLMTVVAGFVVWGAAMSGCGRSEEDLAVGPPGTRPSAVATEPPPPVLSTQPTNDPATPPQSYLFFQYANGDGQ